MNATESPSQVKWKCRRIEFDLARPLLMGIINATPDSFSDGGMFVEATAAVRHALQLVADGADIIDVGGESTRPGSTPVSEEEELRRVVPVVAAIAKATDVAISIDTSKPEVARAAIEAGASIVNDVTGLRDPAMRKIVRETNAGAVVMDGTECPPEADVCEFVTSNLNRLVSDAVADGIPIECIVADPGFGFGKDSAQCLALLNGMAKVCEGVRVPILVGLSRKRFIGEHYGIAEPSQRDAASFNAAQIAVTAGARIVRAHSMHRF